MRHLLAIMAIMRVAHAQTITSVVGHHAGDGYPPEVARLTPEGLACDGYALYAADSASGRVRVFPWSGASMSLSTPTSPPFRGGLAIGPGGVLYAVDGYLGRIWGDVTGPARVVAGSGIVGYSGDGGPALAALLQGPMDVAVGSDGTMFIADTSNGRIRRVSPDGIITTYAGGASASCGTVCDAGVSAAASRFAQPIALGLDPVTGDLYVSNYLGQAVSVVRRATGTVHRVAGTGAAGSFGDGGPATQAQLTQPRGLAVGPDGTLFIADTGNHAVRAVGPDGVIRRIGGAGRRGAGADGDATRSALADPRWLAVCGGALYVSDAGNNRIRRIDLVAAAPTPTRTAMLTPTSAPPSTPTSPPPTDTPVFTATRTPTCGCCSQCA